eukprot:jgi/Orpsp1_1/1177207/evm.model.c7180000060572.1
MLSGNENFFSKKRKNVFGKIYIANVRNRLIVQNAKDSFSGQPNRKVDIILNVISDIYEFKHNGSPFNEDSLFGLLYKFSEGKTDNYESTGRFGTGFLTTHSLSKTVEISGDLIRDNETETIVYAYFEKPLNWTTYRYKAVTQRNKEAGQLGIQNFKENIDKSKIEEYNEKLTERFTKSRNVRICCAIELDIGSEAHELPFIINSPDFEPDSERQSIFLDGNDEDKKTGKISDPGINRMILTKSQGIYRNLLNFVCDNNNKVGKRYMVARGLFSVPPVTRFFDGNRYKDNFIKPMREILHLFPIIWNRNQYKKNF